MVNIDEVQSEVHVGSGNESAQPAGDSPETRREDLREVVRQLLREELARFLRTEARR